MPILTVNVTNVKLITKRYPFHRGGKLRPCQTSHVPATQTRRHGRIFRSNPCLIQNIAVEACRSIAMTSERKTNDKGKCGTFSPDGVENSPAVVVVRLCAYSQQQQRQHPFWSICSLLLPKYRTVQVEWHTTTAALAR